MFRIQRQLNLWHAKFRTYTSGAAQNKLLEEVLEFLSAEPKSTNKLEEGADVVIVVLTQLVDDGFTVRDLSRAVLKKLKVNISRQWKMNLNGTVSHVKGT